MRRVLAEMHWQSWWLFRHRRWLTTWLVLATIAGLVGGPGLYLLGVGFAPFVVCALWHGIAPAPYERWCAAPARRLGWRWWARRHWTGLAERCGLTDHVAITRHRGGQKIAERKIVAPRLRRVRARGHTLQLVVRARAGQTLSDLEAGAERLAATADAHSFRSWPHPNAAGSTLVVEMVMRDILTTPTTAVEPEPRAVVDSTRVGRTQSGRDWLLKIRGRPTLCVGASGSGKGSVLWGICGGLAPAIRADKARLWGVDLKRGVELATGKGLFSALAYTPEKALEVLHALMAVIDARGAVMVGKTRLHEPTVGDPLHVLVIDELAALTAYAPMEVRREAERLIAEILTQGRALGVVVVAFVQDPRKEVVGMRGLFTQTIALRLRASEETSMVLGDGMARLAPAHRIDPTRQGTGWIVEDSGAVDRVRADFWPDDLIRDLATRYGTEVRIDTTPTAERDPGEAGVLADLDLAPRESKPRSPRKPRAPRSAEASKGAA
ncbi:MAG: hypothetical protein L0H93_04605 [Nocardioides sp.]|nr:hypothetical protein [Nocardioides sp.]